MERGFCYPVIKQTSVTMQDTLVASVMAPSTTERQSEPVGSRAAMKFADLHGVADFKASEG